MKKKVFNIIQIGDKSNRLSRLFDIFIAIVICANILVTFLQTFDELAFLFPVFHVVEVLTILIFCVEYILRIWTADYLYPDKNEFRSRLRFLISFDGIIDLLTILPFFFLSGMVIFRMLRVARIFHLFRLNARYDSFNVITTVLYEKRNQIIASFEAQAMQNRRIGNPAGHITLSFSADDKPKLSDDKMLKIALDYIKMMGLDKTQFHIVRHYETDKPHCHIVFNMVGDNGKRMESGRNRYRSKKVCEALTKRYRLALPKQEAPDLEKLHGLERAEAEIKIAATDALRNSRDWHTFAALLAKKNIHIIPKYRRGT